MPKGRDAGIDWSDLVGLVSAKELKRIRQQERALQKKREKIERGGKR